MANARTPLILYGAGGFAREVAWLVSELGPSSSVDLIGFVEDGAAPGRQLHGLPVFDWAALIGVHRDARVAVAVGRPQDRAAMVLKCDTAGLAFATLVHPSVMRSTRVALGEGCIVCAGSILTVDIALGRQVQVNLDCTVGHDVTIGDFSTLAPGVHVSGHVEIGRSVFIGTGAVIIDGTARQPITIGDGAVIAAGACVTGNVEAGALYAGVPATLKKRI